MKTFVSQSKKYRIVLKPTKRIVVDNEVVITKDQTVEFFNGRATVEDSTANVMMSTPYFNKDFFLYDEVKIGKLPKNDQIIVHDSKSTQNETGEEL